MRFYTLCLNYSTNLDIWICHKMLKILNCRYIVSFLLLKDCKLNLRNCDFLKCKTMHSWLLFRVAKTIFQLLKPKVHMEYSWNFDNLVQKSNSQFSLTSFSPFSLYYKTICAKTYSVLKSTILRNSDNPTLLRTSSPRHWIEAIQVSSGEIRVAKNLRWYIPRKGWTEHAKSFASCVLLYYPQWL